MRPKTWIPLLALPLLTASCNDDPASEQAPAPKTIAVSIGSSPDISIQSRTALDESDFSVKWLKGDKIALWAENSQGDLQLEAHEFTLWHYNETFDDAKFTANIEPMPQGTYSYYAVSPVPASTEGTKARYDIPAVQNGTYNSACDVMVADPVTGGGLQEGDNSGTVNLKFSHKIHLLRITIPDNALGEKVEELEIKFPQPVTGTLTVDAADPTAPAELASAGSNTLTLRFEKPADAGTTVYAVIAPVDIPDNEAISFRAIGTTCESKEVYMAGKNFMAGRITPITLNVPELGRKFTRVSLSLADTGKATLGEEVRRITLTAPEGATFDNGSVNRVFTVNADNRYEMIFRNFPEALSGQTIAVSYESENALVGNSFTMPQLADATENTVDPLTVPYLMEEDFSGLTENFSLETTTKDLGNSGLPGWVAANRSQGWAGTCVAVRSYSHIGGPYDSRVNSCRLTGIKEGSSITVTLTFNSDWKKNKSSSMNLIVGRTSGTGLDDAIEDSTSITMENNSSASETNIPTLRTIDIANFTSAQSIAWKTNGKNGTMFNYDNVYLDNIKVSIAE